MSSRLRNVAEALLCFLLPVATLLFLVTGPHGWNAALAWTLPVWLCAVADYFSPADHSLPPPVRHGCLFDAKLYVLFVLHLTNIALFLHLASGLRWATGADVAASVANAIALRVLVGTTSCCSGIALAHELIHRRARHLRWMARILLCTVGYDHFAVAHGGGHHRLASTPLDSATARFGERFADFFWRSVRGQWADAWRQEERRLRLSQVSGLGFWVRHRVLHGVVLEAAGLAWIFACFGGIVALLFLYQAWAAVRMLEAVNYIQHYGLQRSAAKFSPADAWATDSWFTLHSFIGLSRHADHHACASRPYRQLRHCQQSPQLANGYFVTVLQVRVSNSGFMAAASRELAARCLGPFRPICGAGAAKS